VIDAHGVIPKMVCVVSPTEAEITKYFNNVHNAAEVVFANAMNEMCEKLGADYQNVFDAISNRHNIHPGHLKCNDRYRGFGGACLPKDTLAWKQLAQDIGVDVKIFASICNNNRRYK
jgi:UDPglucose 6-dehydrogenase